MKTQGKVVKRAHVPNNVPPTCYFEFSTHISSDAASKQLDC